MGVGGKHHVSWGAGFIMRVEDSELGRAESQEPPPSLMLCPGSDPPHHSGCHFAHLEIRDWNGNSLRPP